MAFSDVDWGQDEAKGDKRLLEYFYQFPGYNLILSGKKRYVVGRKGTGKTAICERLRLEAQQRPNWFTSDISLRGFPIECFHALRDTAYRDKAQYIPIWRFILVTEFSRMIISDTSVSREIVEPLRFFLGRNMFSPGMSSMLRTLQRREGLVTIRRSWLDPYAGNDEETEAHFQSILPWLMEQLKAVKGESKYYVLMDELDEEYDASDKQKALILLALFRSTDVLALEMQRVGVTNFRPLLVLRSDIFTVLADNDLNKYDDATIRLRWNANENALYSLREVVNARLRASLPELNHSRDPWLQVAVDKDSTLPHNVPTLWKYLTNRTFERPRDVLKFLKFCNVRSADGLLRFRQVDEAENGYSQWFYDEFRDEIHAHLDVWAEALTCISRAGTGVLTIDELRTELDRHPKITAWMNIHHKPPEHIVKLLFDFGVLGNLSDKGSWVFKYKDDSSEWNPNAKLIVHLGFNKKLLLAPPGGRKAGLRHEPREPLGVPQKRG